MFTIQYKPSAAHLIFPPIIAGIILILLFAMAIQRYVKCKKQGKPFINKDFKFFKPDADIVKLAGTVVIYALYVLIMPVLHFLPASILCIFLFNLLYGGLDKVREIPVAFKEKTFFKNRGFRSVFFSLIISIVASCLIWFLFAIVFAVTLP